MRIDLKSKANKKQDGIGVGFLIGFAVLCGVGYVVSAPEYAAMFPPKAERALASYRAQIDTAAGEVWRNVSITYASVAGR
jgi:hypothetical protein